VKALPGNPYDGHTLAMVIPDMEALVGNTIERILADKGYRGHNAPPDYKFRVFISGQKRVASPSTRPPTGTKRHPVPNISTALFAWKIDESCGVRPIKKEPTRYPHLNGGAGSNQ
jgi:hypothetical protein